MKKSTIAKQEKVKTLPDEQINKLHQILNDFVSKNRKRHYAILAKRLMKVKGTYVEDEVVEDTLQNIYEYMCLNPETVFSFYETNSLNKLFVLLAYSMTSLNNSKRYYRDLPLLEEYDIPLEEQEHFTMDSMDIRLPIEERLKSHEQAKAELKEWLLDHPDSRLNKALEMTKFDNDLYNVAINFTVTPIGSFLGANKETLHLKNIARNLKEFKLYCEEVYNQPIKKNSQPKRKRF